MVTLGSPAPLSGPDIFTRHSFNLLYSAKDIDGSDWPAEGEPSGRTLTAAGDDASVSSVSSSELTLSALGEHTNYAVAAGDTDGYRVASGWTTNGTSKVWVRTLTRRTGDLFSGYYPYRYLNGSTKYWGWRMLHPTNGNNRQEIRGTTIHAVIPSGSGVALDVWELRDTVFAFDEGGGGVAIIKHMRNGVHGGVSEGEAAITDLGASGGFGVLGSHSGASSPNMQVIAVAIKWDAEPSFAQHQEDAADLGVYEPDDDVFSREGFDLIYSAKDINGSSWPAHGFVTGRTLAAVGASASVSNVSGAGLPPSALGAHTKYAVAAGESDGYALGSGWSTGATSKIWVRTLTRKVDDLYSGYYPYRYVNGSTRYWGWRMLHPTNGANRHEIRGTTIHAVQPSGMGVASSDWELRDTIYSFDAGTEGVATIRHLRNGEDSGLSEGTAAITDLGATGSFGVLGSHTGASSSGMQIVAVGIKWDEEPTLGQHREAAADLGLYTPFCGNGTVDGEEACDDGDTQAGDGCDEVCRIEQVYELSAQAVTEGVQVKWRSTDETGVTDFELYRSSELPLLMELITIVPPEGGPYLYDYIDEEGEQSDHYWLLARGGDGELLAALGPVTVGGPASLSTCRFDDPSRCEGEGYFESDCGLIETRVSATDAEWVCAGELQDFVAASVMSPLSLSDTVIVQPKLIIDEEGQPEETFLQTVLGTKVLYDSSEDVYVGHWVYDVQSVEPPSLTDAQMTDLNGARVESCFEYGYQAVEDYSNWKDHLRHNPKTGLAAVESIFDGPVSFVAVTGSGETLDVTFEGKDSDDVALPQVILGTPLFLQSMPRTVLDLWDPIAHRPEPDPVRIEESWTLQYERYTEAVQEGWSADELEALRTELGVLSHLIFRYNQLEFEAMRTVLEDEMRYSAADVPDAWKLVDLRFRAQDLSDNLHPLSCRWRRFEGLLGSPPGQIQPGWLTDLDIQHLGTSQPPFGFFGQQEALSLAARHMGGDWDPMGGLPGMPTSPPARPLPDDRDYWEGPPAESECDEGDDPDDPLLESPFSSSNFSLRYEYFIERLDHIRATQQLLINLIEEQYALLEPLCDPLEKCMWAPSTLLERLDRHFGGLRLALENRCRRETNDDFDDLNRLFTVTSTANFESNDVTNLLVMQTTDYGSTVTEMHNLFWDLVAFRDMAYRAAIVGLEKLVRHTYQGLRKDGDNRATTVHQDGFGRAHRSKYVATSYREQSRKGIDCTRDGEGNIDIDENIFAIEVLEEPAAWFSLLCKCGLTLTDEKELKGGILTRTASAAPILSTFLDVTRRDYGPPVDIQLGFGLDINVTQGPNFLRASLGAGFELPVLIVPITGPFTVTLSVGGAMSIQAHAEFEVGDEFDDLCLITNPVMRAVHADAGFKGGVDAFAAIELGVPLLLGAGVEGRLRVLDAGTEWEFSGFLERITPERLCRERDTNGVCVATGIETPLDVLNFFRGDLGCDFGMLAQYFDGSDVQLDLEAACPDLLSFSNTEVQDKLFEIRDELTQRAVTELLAGKVSVFVRIVFIKVSIELFSWDGIRHVASEHESHGVFTNGRALCHESINVFPGWVDQSECWP